MFYKTRSKLSWERLSNGQLASRICVPDVYVTTWMTQTSNINIDDRSQTCSGVM